MSFILCLFGNSNFNSTTFKGASQTFNSSNQRTATGYVFDGNGNATTYSGTTCTYDSESRLKSFGANSSYGYRADGLRAWKEVNGNRTYFLYDGGNPVIEMDSSGTTTAINDFGPDGLTARRNSNGVWTYYVFDQQGSVAQRLNSAGGIIGHQTYDAYGVEWSTGNPQDPWGYNAKHGYYFDRDTGKYYCQNRFYDPAQGRWLNRDPIGYAGGMNLYGYCGQGPLGSADRNGLLPVETVLDAAGLGADIAAFAADPSWVNAGMLVWSALALAVPYVPGSWVARIGGKLLHYGDDTIDGANCLSRFSPGRRGGPEHIAGVSAAEESFKAQGFKHIAGGSEKEAMRGNRAPDLIFSDGTNEFFVQIGRQNKNGSPVKRERDAIADLAGFGPTTFIPYNVPGIRRGP